MQFSLPLWYDLHAHFRQDGLLKPMIAAHRAMGCAGILAMPNTKPPTAKVLDNDDLPYWSIEYYLQQMQEAGGDVLDDIIIPLYLTKDTTPEMIEQGAKAGVLRAAKYYPPHGTTNADHGRPLQTYIEKDVFQAMADSNVVLCIHGEEHGLESERYFDRSQNAEEIFYVQRMPRLIDAVPNLKISCEHITTKVAVDFVLGAPDNVSATITPQHLLYTVGDLLQGLKYHLFCLPLLKFDEDRDALRKAAISGNKKFFAGTDSAPHTSKCTPCGCAAGCFTGGIAPQLYAMGFEAAGVDLSGQAGQEALKQFLCLNGPKHYGLTIPEETFTLGKAEAAVHVIETPEGPVVPLPVGLNPGHDMEGTTLPWTLTF